MNASSRMTPTSAIRFSTGKSLSTSPTLVLIASAGHSGSTLLDLLLGNHSHISSAGEMNRLSLHAPDRVCACGATVTRCEYWNDVRAVISRRSNRQDVIRWDECHTDIPPQRPLLQLNLSDELLLTDGQALPESVRHRLKGRGMDISDAAVVSRGGVRDFKWRLNDPVTRNTYVLRLSEGHLDVYSDRVRWKNPIRRVPQPIELALALGLAPALRQLSSWSASAGAHVRTGENSWAVADAMATISGTPFVVDSSKSPLRLKLLYMLRPEHVRVVELVRDGRAVSASAMRRTEISARMAARIWKRDNQNLAIMLRTVPDGLKIRVRYEDICENPQRELERLCAFLGLAFEPQMPTLWQRPVHNIPGNPMLFNRSSQTIRRDDRWRRDLSPDQLATIERIVRPLNRALGYSS